MKRNTIIILIAAIIGAIVGSISGLLLIRQNTSDESIKLSANQGAKVGLNIINLIKQIADLGKPK